MENKIAWLAGFWDGEGSIGLTTKLKTKVLMVQLSHTDLNTVQQLLALLKKIGVRSVGYTYQERDPKKHKDAHYVRITNMSNALKLCRALLPYSVTKRRHFEIAIEWAESRIRAAGGVDAQGRLKRGGIQADRVYTAHEIALADELSQLNRRGPAGRKNNIGRISVPAALRVRERRGAASR